MRQHHVMHLINSGGFYGAERAVLELCKASLGGAFPALLVNFFDLRKPHLELHERAEKEGASTRLILCSRRLDFHALKELRHLITLENVEILHCHGFKADFYGLLAGKSLKIPLVATNHLWTGASRIIRWYERLDGLFLRFFDHVVAVSEPIRAALTKAGVAPRRITIIHYGLSNDRSSSPASAEMLRKKFRLALNDKVIGVIARLSPEKGHHHLLRAARIVGEKDSKARFLLVGDGPLRPVLERDVNALSLGGSVIFAGFQPDMQSIYSLLDIVVLASLREGLPLTILEALAAGLPVIATPVGDVPEVVQDGVTGLLVEPGDEVGLAEAILDLLRDPERRTEMGRQGQKLIAERFSAQRMGQQYAEVYAKVLPIPDDQW